MVSHSAKKVGRICVTGTPLRVEHAFADPVLTRGIAAGIGPQRIVGVRKRQSRSVEQAKQHERGAQDQEQHRPPPGQFEQREACNKESGILGEIGMAARGALERRIAAGADPDPGSDALHGHR